jgi:hypothetical protein
VTSAPWLFIQNREHHLAQQFWLAGFTDTVEKNGPSDKDATPPRL